MLPDMNLAGQHYFLPSAHLKPLGPELQRELEQFARTLDEGSELNALLDPLMRQLLDQTRQQIGADEVSLWLTNPSRTRLGVCFCAPNEALCGTEIPLGSGLIGMVLAAEQGICENTAYQNQRHDKTIDEHVGKITTSIVACPFYVCGELRGVLSFVKLKASLTSPDPAPFQAAELLQAQQLAVILERLLNLRVVQILFDLDRGQL
jgi:hypothetical protein